MRFYWMRDRMDQQQLRIYWTPGKENRGDYYTKHHPLPHHKLMKEEKKLLVNLLTILNQKKFLNQNTLRGGVH